MDATPPRVNEWRGCDHHGRAGGGRRAGRGGAGGAGSRRLGGGSDGVRASDGNIVIGADGRYSLVAKAVNPEQYNERPALAAV
jgi:hypothetical protein